MKLHQLSGYIQTIYLVEYEDKLLLLDGCGRPDIAIIKRFITEDLKRPISDLSLVIVTHMHPDHAGAAQQLRKETGCKLAAANIAGHWYQGLRGRLMHLGDIAATRWVAKKKKMPFKNLWYAPCIKFDLKLDDLALLPGFEEWQVIFTPGHTDRDISLLHLPSNKIYVADLFVKVRKIFIAPLPVFHPIQYKASLQKLHQIAPKSIYLAHDGEVELTENDYLNLIKKAPKLALTPWRSIKLNLSKLWKN